MYYFRVTRFFFWYFKRDILLYLCQCSCLAIGSAVYMALKIPLPDATPYVYHRKSNDNLYTKKYRNKVALA